MLGILLAGCPARPAARRQPIPRLMLLDDTRDMTLSAYGLPKVETVNHLWYVGPEPDSLTHGADGWMTLLSYNDRGLLVAQEYLHRRPQQGYIRTDYWLKGDLGARQRDEDFDTRAVARCVELAQQDANYLVTTRSENLFVLARVLPSENEQVVQWTLSGRGHRREVKLEVRCLPGRDEPLMEYIDGVVQQRMLMLSITLDKEQNPSASGR
jgi:hypothetical protein